MKPYIFIKDLGTIIVGKKNMKYRFWLVSCPVCNIQKEMRSSHVKLRGSSCRKCKTLKWNYLTLKEEALRYKTREEFKNNKKGAYNSAWSLNILDDICSHMIRGCFGFNKDKPAILYYLSINNGQAYKIGITNRTIEERYSSNDLSKIKVISIVEYSLGRDAYKTEQRILKDFSCDKWEGKKLLKVGNTELFSKDVLKLDTKMI